MSAVIQKCHELFVDKPVVRRVDTFVEIDDPTGAGQDEWERKLESARSQPDQASRSWS